MLVISISKIILKYSIQNGYELPREDPSLKNIDEIELLYATHVQSIFSQLKVPSPTPDHGSTSTQNIFSIELSQ